jgi:Rha family phage regulatory protein
MQGLVQRSEIGSKTVLATTSLKIAEVFGKRHNNVIRDIENIAKREVFSTALNFEFSSYKDSSGKSNRFYILDQDFTTFLIMGFTGKEADQWKLKYIHEFNRMREELSKPKIIQQPLIIVPRFKNDSVSSAHKELMSQFKSTFVSIYKRTPTNEEYGKFVAGVNKKVFGYHEKGMRGSLTSHGYIVAINTFDEICRSLKGSRNIGTSVQSSVDRINLELKEVKFPELATEPFALITNGTELVA